MANPVYKEWLKPEKLVLLQGWKREGLTDEQIAANIGINVRTLGKWKNNYRQIGQALKIGKQQANFIIENELFKKAKSGNTTAIIFWLKNNYRDKYNDSQLTEDEIELIRERKRKAKAEADIAEFKAKAFAENSDRVADKVDELLEAINEQLTEDGSDDT